MTSSRAGSIFDSSLFAIGLVRDSSRFTAEEAALIHGLSCEFSLSAASCAEERTGYDCIVLSGGGKSVGDRAWRLVKTPDHCRVSQGAQAFGFPTVRDAVLTIAGTLALEADAGDRERVLDEAERSEAALAVQRRRRAFTVV